MKKLLTLIALLTITHLPISCNYDEGSCECCDFRPKVSTISEIRSEIVANESDGIEKNPDINTLDYQTAAIKTMIYYIDISDNISMNHFNFSLLNQALACSPKPPKPLQAIESIEITSDKSVFANHKKYGSGESLNELFKISNMDCNSNQCDINQFISLQNNYKDLFGYWGDFLVFQLKNPPDLPVHQEFQIIFQFDDAYEITVETGLFRVK